ncbi:hypothetical protein Q2T42_28700 [Leptolyngbya boryana CZ1]|uniref:Uncharacterized protein n=1 Tax=Leptolyngbya boryana CZ1 TaxID=3060204 RepID=A0AA97AQL9_LEPBY|nr:hypothetical protein [Leptolyngbya boryana]WNZ45774.1 hypothetical protein Q2T42_28700 [Leptolyngbya boryana CZ1]
MLSPDLKSQVLTLPVRDRLELMQAIVTSLQSHPMSQLESGVPYEVWTPIDAPEAGQALLALLAANAESAHG